MWVSAKLRGKVLRIFILIIAITAFLGCSPEIKKPQKREEMEEITISGAGTGLPWIEIMAKAYTANHPEAKIEFLPEIHTSGGIKGVAQGTLDIGVIARYPNTEEKKYQLKYRLVAKVALVMAVNPNVKITNLSSQQIRDVYSGKITNWKQVGGHDAKIVVLDRNEDGSAKIYLRQHILGEELKITDEVTLFYHEGDMAEMIKTTPNAIGFLASTLVQENKLRALSLDGVAPSMQNVQNGKYKMRRNLGIVTKGQPKGLSEKFINFIFSSKGQKILLKNGYAPTSLLKD